MSRRNLAIVSLVLVMGIWGSAFTITKAAGIPPALLALLRFGLASAILLPLALVRRGRDARPIAGAREWGIVAAMGLCGFTRNQAGANLALAYTTATQGSLIQSVIPVATAVLAALVLKERPTGRRLLGIGLSLAGVVALVLAAAPSEYASNPLLGGAIMLGSVLAWACYTILGKHLAHVDPLAVTAYSSVFGALFLIPLALIEARGLGFPAISAQGWLAVLYLGMLASATANLVYNRALTLLDASQTATFINLVPIAGVAIAVIFLGEPVLALQLVGGTVALIGVWLAT
jgi:drug/metabolite transporter (DMT)-like permease